jgi:predicted permease
VVADSLFQDIRYAVRTIRRVPLFAATVAATMGLGLGLSGSAFTILNAYLLRPIDLPDPHALYALRWDSETTQRHRFRLADYEALQPEARRFAGLAAAQDVTVMQDSVSTQGLLVTGNYFELLGARPALGRLLRPDDAAARGGVAVVVLSHQTWRSRYGSDPAIVGQRILLGRQRFEVVGVTEPHAYLPGQEGVSFWAPLTMAGAFPGADPWSEPDAASLAVVGRLRQDVTAAAVHAWLEMWLRQRFPSPSDAVPVAVHIDSLATRMPLDGKTLTMFVLIMSAFGLVLVVACANVTNLMLARALARQPEIAVRLALGASRWRVARQLIVESLVLAVPAAAAGLALIIVTARVFPAVILATFPVSVAPLENILAPLDPDWRVMAFLAAAAVLSAMLITLAPAGRLAGMRLAHASQGEASSDVRGSRLRSGLVAMQIGACALFLVGAMALHCSMNRRV